MMSVVSSLLAVGILAVAVNAVPIRTTSAAAAAAPNYYYEPVVPFGPYPAPGYVVSSYLPKYTQYNVIAPVRYPPRKTDYDDDQYDDDKEPKYYYGGKFKGTPLIYEKNKVESDNSTNNQLASSFRRSAR